MPHLTVGRGEMTWMRWLLVVVFVGVALRGAPRPAVSTVNPLIGDASWIAAHGRPPGPDDDDRERVRVHLAYVERLLRARPAPSPGLEAARTRTLDHLAAYHARGVFPWNDDHPDARRPTFIDDAGTLCAVGYLLAADRGRPAAEAIAATRKYAYVRELHDPELVSWIADSGLRPDEVALIQPTYPVHASPDPLPAFTLLDPHGAHSQVYGAAGFAQGGATPPDGALHAAWMPGSGWARVGPYATGSHLAGSSGAELGAVGTFEAWGWARLLWRAGGVVSTSAAASPSPSTAALHAGDSGLRLWASPRGVVGCRSWIASPATCFLRLDAGVDVFGATWTPRFGAGLGYRTPIGVYMVELAHAVGRTTVGGTLRYVHYQDSDWWHKIRPGFGMAWPLDGGPWRMTADLQVMLGDFRPHEVW
jgi:hypothetical protein